MTSRPKKILFVAECVTLAHMARPFVLANTLKRANYEVIFAADGRFDDLFPAIPGKRETVFSISSKHFLEALAKGKPVYDRATLERYVEDDLTLFKRVKPDVVVGDFRLSLSISARIADIPYICISNIYWSPYIKQHYPVPELPMVSLLGVPVSQAIFNLIRPIAFMLHTIPLNAVRKNYGLDSLGTDLHRVYTDADVTLYADLSCLFETTPLPSTHRFIGPLLWSPQVPLPSWWDKVDDTLPVIYLTPGSSGSAEKMQSLTAALASLPATVLVATAGQWTTSAKTPQVFIAEFLPGKQVVEKADIVVCNGGSPTTSQSLAAGVPVIGIPTNLDQYLNISALEKAGLGVAMRSGSITPKALLESVHQILDDPSYAKRAERVKRVINNMSVGELFTTALAQVE